MTGFFDDAGKLGAAYSGHTYSNNLLPAHAGQITLQKLREICREVQRMAGNPTVDAVALRAANGRVSDFRSCHIGGMRIAESDWVEPGAIVGFANCAGYGLASPDVVARFRFDAWMKRLESELRGGGASG